MAAGRGLIGRRTGFECAAGIEPDQFLGGRGLGQEFGLLAQGQQRQRARLGRRGRCGLGALGRSGRLVAGRRQGLRRGQLLEQPFEQGLLAQQRVDGVGQQRALARPQAALLAAILAHGRVGGMGKGQGLRDQFRAMVNQGFRVHGRIVVDGPQGPLPRGSGIILLHV